MQEPSNESDLRPGASSRNLGAVGRPPGQKNMTAEAFRPSERVLSDMKLAVGARIREVRRDCGVSASELGAAIGRTEQIVYQWERGERGISMAMFLSIALALRCRATDLLPDIAHEIL